MTDREPTVLDFATAREAFLRIIRLAPDGVVAVSKETR